MSLSIFSEKGLMPNDEILGEVLSDCKPLWESIKNSIIATNKNISEEWKFYSKSAGWTLVIKSGKRTLLYFIPLDSYFKVNFVFGERAVAAAQSEELPENIVTLILEAKPHMEGRSFMVDVKTHADVDAIIKLLEIKSKN